MSEVRSRAFVLNGSDIRLFSRHERNHPTLQGFQRSVLGCIVSKCAAQTNFGWYSEQNLALSKAGAGFIFLQQLPRKTFICKTIFMTYI